MKAIVWKELREHLKWGVLSMVVIAIAMVCALEPMPRGGRIISLNARSVASSGFLTVMVVGPAAIGFLLGLLQGVQEIRRSQWALIAHLPVSLSTVFLGKAITGVSLHLAACTIPFLLASWWASTPGHVAAPFDARMMLPGCVGIVVGLAYYFAGMLTGLRRARWYASRALGLGFAIVASVAMAALPTFSLALTVVLASVVFIAVAAWGSFVAAGEYVPQPRLAKVALNISVGLGIGVVWSLLLGGLVGWLVEGEHVPRARYQISREGRALRVVDAGPDGLRVTDVNGKPIFGMKDPIDREALEALTTRLDMVFLRDRGEDADAGLGYHYWFDHGVSRVSYSRNTRWYYLRKQGVYVVYDSQTATRRGYVGAGDLSLQEEMPEQRFVGEGPRLLWFGLLIDFYLIFPDAVYEVAESSEVPSLRRVFAAEEGDEVLGARSVHSEEDSAQEAWVVTRQWVYRLAGDGTQLLKLALPRSPTKFEALAVARLEENRFVLWQGSQQIGLGRSANAPDRLRVVAADGRILSEEELPVLRQERPAPSTWRSLTGLGLPLIAASVLAFDVNSWHPLGPLLPSLSLESGQRVFMLLSALVCASLAAWLTWRHAFARWRCVLWIVVGILLGPIGILTLLAVQHWPARETCEGCGRPRVVDRECCKRCGAAWPEPKHDGTEIFEGVSG